MNEITNNHDNELTERKDPIVALVGLGAAAAVGIHAAIDKARKRRKGKK